MNYRGYYITSTYDSGVERGNGTVEGYYCEVFRSDDEDYSNKLDDFCLGMGFEISDLNSDTLSKALKQYIDEHIDFLNDISYETKTDRYKNIIQKALDWFSEHFEAKELLDILHEHLDMTDAEIDYFGYDFSDLEQKEDNRFSIIHLHDFNEDYCLTSSKSYDLYDAAEIYHKYMKADVGKLTLDSLAHWFDDPNWIDERLYPILCQSLNKNGEISTIINFDFANEELIYSIDSELRVYDLEEISNAYTEVNQDNELYPEIRRNIFYMNIFGKEIECSTESDEEESPSMRM